MTIQARRHATPAAGFLLLLCAANIAGCASTGLVNAWRDPQGPPAPLQNVLVMALNKQEAPRRLMEDAFVAALAKHGVQATPSYRLFGSAAPDSQQVEEMVVRNGYDGMIISSKLATDLQEVVTPGYVTSEPRTRYSSWRGVYRTYWVEVEHPGYVETQSVVRHRVDVYTTKDGGHLAWTGEGRSIDPTSSTSVAKEITSVVIPELAKGGIIPKAKV